MLTSRVYQALANTLSPLADQKLRSLLLLLRPLLLSTITWTSQMVSAVAVSHNPF